MSIPGNEIYEAMSQGVVDCTMISAPELLNLQLIDVTKYITTGVPGGVFAGSGAANINRDTWMSLSEDQRSFLLEAAARNAANVSIRYNNAAKEALDASRERGIEVIEAPQELLDASEAFVEEDVKVVARQFAETYGLDNVDEKMEIVTGLVEKWKSKAEGLEQDPEALGELFWTEVFSKVDAASYGMN